MNIRKHDNHGRSAEHSFELLATVRPSAIRRPPEDGGTDQFQ